MKELVISVLWFSGAYYLFLQKIKVIYHGKMMIIIAYCRIPQNGIPIVILLWPVAQDEHDLVCHVYASVVVVSRHRGRAAGIVGWIVRGNTHAITYKDYLGCGVCAARVGEDSVVGHVFIGRAALQRQIYRCGSVPRGDGEILEIGAVVAGRLQPPLSELLANVFRRTIFSFRSSQSPL